MTSGKLFLLNNDFGLAYDSNQWIIQRIDHKDGGKVYYTAVSFIGGRLSTLERVIREMGIKLTDDARRRLNGFPGTFLEWYEKTGRRTSAGPF